MLPWIFLILLLLAVAIWALKAYLLKPVISVEEFRTAFPAERVHALLGFSEPIRFSSSSYSIGGLCNVSFALERDAEPVRVDRLVAGVQIASYRRLMPGIRYADTEVASKFERDKIGKESWAQIVHQETSIGSQGGVLLFATSDGKWDVLITSVTESGTLNGLYRLGEEIDAWLCARDAEKK